MSEAKKFSDHPVAEVTSADFVPIIKDGAMAKGHVQAPLGLSVKEISFIEDPGGSYVRILISDIGAYPVATGFSKHGFCGLAFKDNNGYVKGLGMAVINAIASYSLTATSTSNGVLLNSTHSNITPHVCKYNGRCYLAIDISGNTGIVSLVGYCFKLLENPIVLNNRNDMNVADSETLF